VPGGVVPGLRQRSDDSTGQAGQRVSALEPYAGKSVFSNHGRRIVVGQRLMQAASDMMLGWTVGKLGGRHFYLRQLRDMKLSAIIESMDAEILGIYATLCGWALARAHARSGDPAMIAGYLGNSDVFDKAIAKFAGAYADQTEKDYKAMRQGARDRRLEGCRDRRIVGSMPSPFWVTTRRCGWRSARCARLAGPPDHGRLPCPVKNSRATPVGADVEGKMSCWRGKPVRFSLRAGRLGSDIQRERTISVSFQGLVLGAKGIAVKLVGVKEVVLVVERDGPEPVDRRFLTGGECYLEVLAPLERSPGRVVVGIEVFSLGRLVIEHIRLGGPGAIEVVETPLGVVRRAVPAIAGGLSIALPLEEWGDDFFLSRDRGLDKRLLDLGVLVGHIKEFDRLAGEEGAEIDP
jgi:Uncharacterized protein conserved in bacteria (DUF2252)